MYVAAGRGWLHGLPMYRELFETKPPLIFLLTALSLTVSHGPAFANALEVLFLIALPVLCLGFAVLTHNTVSQEQRWTFCISMLLFGLLLALYVQNRAGNLETESFGVVFALLYVFTLSVNREHVSTVRMWIAAVAIFFAVMIKEPFILPIFASALLLSRSPRFLVRSFVAPAAIAGIAALLFLGLLGVLPAYISIYLPRVFFVRIALGSTAPWWFNATMLVSIVQDFASSPVFLGGLLVAVLWIAAPAMRTAPKILKNSLLSSAAMIGLGLASFFQFRIASRISQSGFRIPWSDAAFQLYASLFVLLIIGVVASLVSLRKDKQYLRSVVLTILAGYLTMLSIALGALGSHQFVFAVPLYATCMVLLWSAHSGSAMRVRTAVLVVLSIAALTIPFAHYTQARKDFDAATAKEAQMKIAAAQIDRVMDDCMMQRYMTWRVKDFWGLMSHDALALWYEEGRTAGPKMNPGVRKEFFAHLAVTPLLIVKDHETLNRYDDTEFVRYVDTHFTSRPPKCVQTALPKDWQLYFRKG